MRFPVSRLEKAVGSLFTPKWLSPFRGRQESCRPPRGKGQSGSLGGQSHSAAQARRGEESRATCGGARSPRLGGSLSQYSASSHTHRAAAGLSRSPAGAGLRFHPWLSAGAAPVRAPGPPSSRRPTAGGHREMRPRLSASTHPGSCGRGAKARTPTALVPSRAHRATRTPAKRARERAPPRRTSHPGPPWPRLTGVGRHLGRVQSVDELPQIVLPPVHLPVPPHEELPGGRHCDEAGTLKVRSSAQLLPLAAYIERGEAELRPPRVLCHGWPGPRKPCPRPRPPPALRSSDVTTILVATFQGWLGLTVASAAIARLWGEGESCAPGRHSGEPPVHGCSPPEGQRDPEGGAGCRPGHSTPRLGLRSLRGFSPNSGKMNPLPPSERPHP